MAPFSEVLNNQLNDLEMSFKVLAERLPEAGELLESLGRPVPQELLRELANSTEQFEEIKREVLKLSESVVALPQTSELGSIRDLRSFMESLSAVIEKQAAHRNIQQAACGVLEEVLTITHADGIEFAPLFECQEKARELRDSIAETVWPDTHPDADALAAGRHVFSEFVKLVISNGRLEDEEWERLQHLVNHSLGRPLGLAASRGKLVIPTSAPPLPQVPVSVPQPAAGPKEEIGATEEMAAGGVPPSGIDEQGDGFHSGETSASVDLPIDPPPQMPPVTADKAVTELDSLEASGGLAPEPVGLSGPSDATSTDQPHYSPAPEPSGVLTPGPTFEGTLDDIRYMLVLDLIDSKGMAKALSSKIIAASNAAARDDKKTAEDFLKAFIKEVNAQTGRHISGAAPQLLLTDANSLLGQLQ